MTISTITSRTNSPLCEPGSGVAVGHGWARILCAVIFVMSATLVALVPSNPGVQAAGLRHRPEPGAQSVTGERTHWSARPLAAGSLDCSNPSTVEGVTAGQNVTGAALLETTDSGDPGENEPLDIDLNGTLEAQITQYYSVTPFSFTASSAGTVTACVEGYDDDEGAVVQLRPIGGAPGEAESLGNLNSCERCLARAFGLGGDPVNTATGNFSESFTDFQIPGRGFPFSFTHTYNSLAAGQNGPLGYGWTFNGGMSLSQDGSGNVTISQENGAQVTFSPAAGGAYSAPPRVVATLAKNIDGTYTFTRLNQQTFIFSAAGELTSERDLNGYVTSFGYNSSQQLTSITDPAGRSLTLAYTGAHLISVTDPAGRTVSFAYDGQGNLSGVTDANGGVTSFTYDSSHLLLTMTDPRGGVLTNVYDGSGRVTSQTDAMGRTTTFSYSGDNQSASGGSTTVTDPMGNVTVDIYAFGLRLTTTKGYGTSSAATWAYTYDPATVGVVTTTDPNDQMTTNTYDTNGNLLSTTDPLGRTTSHTYNALNEMMSTTDPLGITTDVSYDADGNPTSQTQNGNSPTIAPISWFKAVRVRKVVHFTWRVATRYGVLGFFIYAKNQRLTGLIPLHASRNYAQAVQWSRRGPFWLNVLLSSGKQDRVPATKSRGTLGRNTRRAATGPTTTTTYTYGDPGHPGDMTATVDANGNTWAYTYDAYGDRTSATDPLGDKTTYTYNNIGEMLSETSPNGNALGSSPGAYTTSYQYDPLGDVTSTSDAMGHTTSRVYDADRNLVQLTDGKGNVATYTYDADSELTQTKRADGTVLKTDYNADGTVLNQIDGAGNKTSYIYDPLARVSSVTDPLNRTTSYSYDGNGNLTSTTNPDGASTYYTYDVGDQLTDVSYDDGVTPEVSIDYDVDGQRTSMTDGTGTTTWMYDQLHRLSGSTDGAGNTLAYGYDPNGNLTTITYPGGEVVNRTYDAANRLSSLTDWLGNKTTFGYDADSNLISQTMPASTGETDNFSYNAADQVTGISDMEGPATLASFTYTRDADNQLTSTSQSGMPGPSSETYGYTPLNQIQSDNSASYSYDSADNITGLTSGATLSYDATNEVTSESQGGNTTAFTYNNEGDRTAETPASGTGPTYAYDEANRLTGYTNGSITASYTYNGDGLRMIKTVDGSSESFVWNTADSLPLLLQDGTTSYVYGADDLPLEQISSSNSVLYYHHDQIGSTRMVTNQAGAVDADYTYDAYGNLTHSTGSINNPFLYAGQFTDAESGLIYLRERYYDPQTSQFLEVDPKAGTTRSRYAYVLGDPLNVSDPLGLDGCGFNPFCYVGGAAGDVAGAVSSGWNATGGQVVHTIQNGGLPNGHCIVFLQNNCAEDWTDNVNAVDNTPVLGFVLRADPTLSLVFDYTEWQNGEKPFSPLDLAFDVFGFVPLPMDRLDAYLGGLLADSGHTLSGVRLYNFLRSYLGQFGESSVTQLAQLAIDDAAATC